MSRVPAAMPPLGHFTVHELPDVLAVLAAGICIGWLLAVAWLRRSE